MRRRRVRGFAEDRRPPRVITVFSSPRDPRRGHLVCGPLVLPCALGRCGVTHLKREGDGATPAGRMRLIGMLFRPDRGLPPPGNTPLRAIRRTDGWCDAPDHGAYNRPVHLPVAASHETLWREDRLYDRVGILDWNIAPRRSRAGSAIFLHCARGDLQPTAGCIALRRGDLGRLLAIAGPSPVFAVAASPRPLRRAGTPRRRREF
jgi:L,D-peptidoglycan transpeptidase YkuD (ErfK/YbiS/YcfS/YnhG family)